MTSENTQEAVWILYVNSQTCTEDKLGRTGKAPGEARVQKRGNSVSRGAGRVSPSGWELDNLGTPALNPFRPKLSFIFGRRTTSLPFLTRPAYFPHA